MQELVKLGLQLSTTLVTNLVLHGHNDSHEDIVPRLGLAPNVQLLHPQRKGSGNTFTCTKSQG